MLLFRRMFGVDMILLRPALASSWRICQTVARALSRDASHGDADLHHVVQVLMFWITLVQTQPFHELRLRLALGKGSYFRSHGVLTLHALVPRIYD